MTTKKIETLSDKISSVLNTAPSVIDPEDDVYEQTKARVVENDFSDYEDDFVSSLIRKKNVDLLEDVDKRYAGKKKTRNTLHSDDSEEITSDSSASEDEKIPSDDDDSANEESEEDLVEETLNSNEKSDVSDEEENENFQHLKQINVSAQVQKGECVRRQLQIWEKILEMRIKFQKCLLTANKLPQCNNFKTIKDQGKSEFENAETLAENSLSLLLNQLLNLQSTLLISYPETKNLMKDVSKKKRKVEDNEEEIPSDSDEDDNGSEHEDSSVLDLPPNKKLKLDEYENIISTQFDKYKNYRNKVIKKWNEKTHITVVKNSANTSSILNQIDYILKDKNKCIKRTQLKRSAYKIIGAKSKEPENEATDSGNRSSEDYNTEIFDDDDFYHQLLRELIEFKSADVTDPIQLSRQWIALQHMRSKMKRKVDTKATKGRKIRYAVHSKLVNFMAPILNHNWTNEAKNELFSSLFGSKALPETQTRN